MSGLVKSILLEIVQIRWGLRASKWPLLRMLLHHLRGVTDVVMDVHTAMAMAADITGLLSGLLFTISFLLFPYASWWSMLRENERLVWGDLLQGHAFAELALSMPGGDLTCLRPLATVSADAVALCCALVMANL